MPKKKTVELNIPVVLDLIKKEFRSNVVFCEKMGRASGKWVSDWCRKDQDENPKPKNLPSPEEAAKMCLLLDTTPDEILLAEGDTAEETAKRQADIEMVRELLEELKADQGAKKAPTGNIADGRDLEFAELLGKLTDAEKYVILAQLRGLAQGR